jgi:hypothetical protein
MQAVKKKMCPTSHPHSRFFFLFPSLTQTESLRHDASGPLAVHLPCDALRPYRANPLAPAVCTSSLLLTR